RWPDPIFPMVVVGEATAGPAQVGDLDLAQRLDDIVTQPPRPVALAVPDAVVDVAAQVLGEVAVDVPADGVLAEVGVHHQPDSLLRRARVRRHTQREYREDRCRSLDHRSRSLFLTVIGVATMLPPIVSRD